MELTQRLECTQELYYNNSEKTLQEQIGFLGICGNKYPLNKGPNKIGRDPETCNIVLNLNSISRQHAVINVLNAKDIMLMDLDSANKTKLSGKKLQAYIAQPLKNGDMIQFGDILGVFRLLKEDNELPMTQAIDIPDTPVQNRHISKINTHATTIPESPEVSDKEDSFIASSQQKAKNTFKSPNNNFLKSSGKIIAIKPVGTNKIDNIFWSSSKKSDSFSTQTNISKNLDESVASPQNSITHTNEQSIFDMDTQIPNENISKELYECDTQVPFVNEKESGDSIYNATTQIVNPSSPNISEMETQIPTVEKLPDICMLHEQENLRIRFSIDNKENDNSISNAETHFLKRQMLPKDIFNAETQVQNIEVKTISLKVNEIVSNKPKLTSPNNISDDIILFDEIDNQTIEDDFESQQLLSPKLHANKPLDDEDVFIPQSQIIKPVPQKRVNRIESESSTDCEDINIAATQIIPTVTNVDDDLTDCEDEPKAVLKEKNNQRKSPDIDGDSTDCELNDDDVIQPNRVVQKKNFEDQPTQILEDVKDVTDFAKKASKHDNFEFLQTQIIEEYKDIENTEIRLSDLPTQVIGPERQGTSFEELQHTVPSQYSVKSKKKIDENFNLNKSNSVIQKVIDDDDDDDDEKYYAATQELFNDLCSQKPTPEVKITEIREKQSVEHKTSLIKFNVSSHTESESVKGKINEVVGPERQCASFEEALTQQIFSEEVVQFKVPLQSSIKKKKKVDEILKPNKSNSVIQIVDNDDDDEMYYAATQELFNDLCSQKPTSPEVKIMEIEENQSVEHQTNFIKVNVASPNECESSDVDKKIDEFVSNLTCSQIEDVVGVIKQATVIQKMPSDKSDILITPKKIDCQSIFEIELPNTQEIKTGISLVHNSDTESLTESNNQSESELDSEKNTPMKLKLKPKVVQKIRINLSDKFDPEAIPIRSSTRIRKPTSKMLNCDENFQNTAENLLKQVSIKNKDDELKKTIDKSGKEKSSRSKDKIEDTDQPTKNNIQLKERRSADKSDSNKTLSDNLDKKETRRGRNAKQKHEVNVDSKEKIVDNTNSNSSGRSTRTKRKLDENSRSDSNSSKSKSQEENKQKSDVNNKNTEKRAKERSISPEMVIRQKPTKERSKSPETQKKKTTVKTLKSPEMVTSKTTMEKSKSSEKGRKRVTTTKDSPSSSGVGKSSKDRSKSPKIEKIRKATKSSEKPTTSKETEIRRSTRNRSKKSDEPNNVSNTLKHEESKVYNMIRVSSDTSTESPMKQKRPATSELDMPNAKKPKSDETQKESQKKSNIKSILRATPARKTKQQYVLFTALSSDEIKDKLEKLGAVIVSDVRSCTVVLTMEIKRTFKLLCAVGLGKPIVGPNWVQACADTNMIVDPWLYLLQDEAAERRFKFNLQQSLVAKRDFLKGYSVSSTPSVMPAPPEMKLIVECSGGKWEEGGRNWVCLSTPADRALWPALKRKGAIVVSTEFILGGVLRQTIDMEKNML